MKIHEIDSKYWDVPVRKGSTIVRVVEVNELNKEIEKNLGNDLMMHTHTKGDPPCSRCDINKYIKRKKEELVRLFNEVKEE